MTNLKVLATILVIAPHWQKGSRAASLPVVLQARDASGSNVNVGNSGRGIGIQDVPSIPIVDPFVAGLAGSLGLTTHWLAPLPPSGSASQPFSYVLDKWQLWGDRLYGGKQTNMHIVSDPYGQSQNQPSTASSPSQPQPQMVLEVDYQKGSYRQGENSSSGGATFFPYPNELNGAKRVLLSYQVAFKSDFDFVKGGKLPGIFSGADQKSCSGGRQSDGNCFSVRMMWRENGAGEAYAYLPSVNNLCPAQSPASSPPTTAKKIKRDDAFEANPGSDGTGDIICNSDYGTSLGRGKFNFTRGKYTNITILVELNSDSSKKDGNLKIWANGQLVVSLSNLILYGMGSNSIASTDSGTSAPAVGIGAQASSAVGVDVAGVSVGVGDGAGGSGSVTDDTGNPLRIFFSSFFGGSTPDWASSKDTSTYFKNLEIWSDAPPSTMNQLDDENSSSGKLTGRGRHGSSETSGSSKGAIVLPFMAQMVTVALIMIMCSALL